VPIPTELVGSLPRPTKLPQACDEGKVSLGLEGAAMAPQELGV
jgi:hypothetical protein